MVLTQLSSYLSRIVCIKEGFYLPINAQENFSDRFGEFLRRLDNLTHLCPDSFFIVCHDMA